MRGALLLCVGVSELLGVSHRAQFVQQLLVKHFLARADVTGESAQNSQQQMKQI
jgi:hypothetical protein